MAAAVAMRGRNSFKEVLMGSIFGADAGAAYGRSGPVAERSRAIAAGRPPYGDPVERGLSFTIKEARNRLHDLVSGAQKIRTIDQLVSYLRDNFMSAEIRSYGGAGKGTLHVRDQVTGGSAPGAAIHSILSTRGLRKLSGRDVAAEAARPPSEVEVRYRDALRVSYKGQPVNYTEWEALKTGLPAALSRKIALAYTISGGVAYVGRPGADPRKPLECMGTTQRTREMLYEHLVATNPNRTPPFPPIERFRALPEERQTRFLASHYVFDEAMTPRTPVLMRDKFLAQATKISPELAADRLQAKFGSSFTSHWARFHIDQVRSRKDARDDKVVDFHAAVAALRSGPAGAAPAREAPAEVSPPAGNGFGGIEATRSRSNSIGIVIVIDDTSPEMRICRHRPDGNHVEDPEIKSLHDLPKGNYRLLIAGATVDAPSGFVSVGPDHSLTFLDARRREHNLDGPSHVPAPGSDPKGKRWSVDGQALSEAEWVARVEPDPEPAPDPDVEGPRFGFGSAPG